MSVVQDIGFKVRRPVALLQGIFPLDSAKYENWIWRIREFVTQSAQK
jgi:hypothetical protein